MPEDEDTRTSRRSPITEHLRTGARAAIRSAVAICEKNKIPFALENHKDWTLEQIVEIFKGYSSENVGACLDFGNNISLLDDPMDVVEQFAPYALTTHVKDMGLESYPDGFLLSEVRLGEGVLDLPRMFAMVRQARPKTNFILEMITRDPLKVPCLQTVTGPRSRTAAAVISPVLSGWCRVNRNGASRFRASVSLGARSSCASKRTT